jgi:hypothetical protein
MPEDFIEVRHHPYGGVSIKHVDGVTWKYYASEEAATYVLTKASKDALERLNRLVAERRNVR